MKAIEALERLEKISVLLEGADREALTYACQTVRRQLGMWHSVANKDMPKTDGVYLVMTKLGAYGVSDYEADKQEFKRKNVTYWRSFSECEADKG